MVLTEDGEADFYYAARNSTQPLSIPTLDNAGSFPTPPEYTAGSIGSMNVPGANTAMLTGQASSLAGSLTTAAVPVPMPAMAGSPTGGEMEGSDMGSFNSLGGMSWGTPPGDSAGAAVGGATAGVSPMMSPQFAPHLGPGGSALPGASAGGFVMGPAQGSELPTGAVMRAGGFGQPGAPPTPRPRYPMTSDALSFRSHKACMHDFCRLLS